VLRLRHYERISVENGGFRSNWVSLTQNFREKGSLPTNRPLNSSQKTRITRSFTWYKNMGRNFFYFVTIHAFDRQTDGRTAFWWLDRYACNACSAVKNLRLLRCFRLNLPCLVIFMVCTCNNKPIVFLCVFGCLKFLSDISLS